MIAHSMHPKNQDWISALLLLHWLPQMQFYSGLNLLSEKEEVVYLASNFLCVKNIQGYFFCCFWINFSWAWILSSNDEHVFHDQWTKLDFLFFPVSFSSQSLLISLFLCDDSNSNLFKGWGLTTVFVAGKSKLFCLLAH